MLGEGFRSFFPKYSPKGPKAGWLKKHERFVKQNPWHEACAILIGSRSGILMSHETMPDYILDGGRFTHLKNMLIKLDHFPYFLGGENSKKCEATT